MTQPSPPESPEPFPMLDNVNMEILPRREAPPADQHARGPPMAPGDAWQPVPVEPAITRKPVGSPPLRNGTLKEMSLDLGCDDADFAARDRSGSGGYRRAYDATQAGRGRSTSNSSTTLHSRAGSNPPTPGHVRYGSNPTPGHGRSGSNNSAAGHIWYGSSPPTAYRPGSNPSTPGKENTASPQLHQRADSAAGLLTSAPTAGMGGLVYCPPGYQPVGPSEPPATPTRPNFLLRLWLPCYSMYFLLLVGVLFAVGHHIFYRSLDGQDAMNQIRLLRYGAALSFLCKAALAAAAVTAFRQRVWMTVRRKVLSLAAVDSLFAATEDLPALFNLELFKQAKLAMLLAIYVWCTPLVVIFASETLVVEPTTVVEKTLCPSVRSFNFKHEGTNEWRVPHKVEGLNELSVSYWNATTVRDEHDNPDSFDYYTMPSQPVEEVATLASFLKTPIMCDNAAANICSPGWNCTFTIDFIAPGYKCTELASGVGSPVKKLRGVSPPFDIDDLAPRGNLTYIAEAYEGEYAPEQVPSSNGGVPFDGPPFPRDLGALRTEPVVWVGYAAVEDPSKPQPGAQDEDGWDEAFTPKILGCEHYETRYQVDFTYNSSLQHTHVRSREYLGRVIDTTLVRGDEADDGTLDNTTAVPRDNYLYPRGDTERYRVAAAYHSLGAQFRLFVNGTITEPNKITKTRLTQTKLVDLHSWLAVPDFDKKLPTLYEDMILSMLSNPQFLAVVWAYDPDVVSGKAKGGPETRYPCTRHRTANRYKYHAADLWAVYTVAVLFCILAVAYGTYAVLDEGVTRTTRFSAIAAATRGPALEKVPWRAEEGVWYATGEAGRVRVGYGVVVSKGSSGFGVEGDVVQEGRRRRLRRRETGEGQGEGQGEGERV